MDTPDPVWICQTKISGGLRRCTGEVVLLTERG
jgi:hypothetical protein